MKDTVVISGALPGVTLPWWIELIDPAYQTLISIVAGVILLLTGYNKILEIRQRRRDLKDDD